jgi:hypothetical protein
VTKWPAGKAFYAISRPNVRAPARAYRPGAHHYPSPNLNTAHFYIRTDEKGVFEDILEDVSRKLAAESPEITITVRRETHGGNKPYKQPLKHREVPTVSVDSSHARTPIARIIEGTHDYREGGVNTVGKGGRIQILQTIGQGGAVVEDGWTSSTATASRHAGSCAGRCIDSFRATATGSGAL